MVDSGRVTKLRRTVYLTALFCSCFSRYYGFRVVPVRVSIDVELRRVLQLTREEKKARLFLPPEQVDTGRSVV